MRRNVLPPLEGLDLDMRAVAEAAARRAGLSLEEWVSATLADRNDHSGFAKRSHHRPADELDSIMARLARTSRARQDNARQDNDLQAIIEAAAAERDRHENDRSSRTNAALESMASWIERAEDRLDQMSRASADQQDRLAAALSDALEALKDRLDTVERHVVTERASATPARIEFPTLEAAKALSPLSDTLLGLRSDMSRLTERLEQPIQLGLPPAIEDLKKDITRLQGTVGSLATREEIVTLDSLVRQLAAKLAQDHDRKDIRALAQTVTDLQHQIQPVLSGNADAIYNKVTGQIEKLKDRIDRVAKTGVDRSAIEFLSSQIVDMRQDLAHRAEPQQIAQLSGDIASLGRQVAELRQNHVGRGDFAALKNSLEDVCNVLNRTATAQAKSDVPSRLQDLSDRITLLANRPDPTPPNLEPVAKQLALLTERMGTLNEDRNGRTQTLATLIDRLSGQIQALAERSEPSPDSILQRFERLEDELRHVGQQADTSTVESMLRSLSEQLEQRPVHHLDALDQRIATLTERLAEAHTEPVRKVVDEANGHLKALQSEAAQIAEKAAKAALKSAGTEIPHGGDLNALKQGFVELKALHMRADKKSQQTLRAVHDALETLVTRFADHAIMPEKDGHRPTDSGLPIDRLEAAVRKLHAATLSRAEEIATVTTSEAHLASGQEPAEISRPTMDPTKPAEPKPDAPRRSVLATTFSPVTDNPGDMRVNFIAAARRAAQTAAPVQDIAVEKSVDAAQKESSQDTSAHDEPLASPEIQESLIERIRKTLESHKRSLLLSLAILALTAGSFQVVSSIAAPEAPPVGKAAAPAPLPLDFKAKRSPPEPVSSMETRLFQPADLSSTPAPAPTAKFFVDPRTLGELPQSVPEVLRKAALNGDASAIYEIASRAAEGRGMSQDPALSARLFERAALAGLAPAQERLAMFYEKGFGVPRDLKLAVTWYERAATGGNIRAMHNLATLLATGTGGKPDYAAAMQWYLEAAEAGVRDSQFNIGLLFARAIGTRSDFGQAYKWFALAAAQGDSEAAKKRDEIAAKLGPAELAAAKSLVEHWQPRTVEILANEVTLPAESATAAFQAVRGDKI